MGSDPERNWMWSEACALLARAEQLHRQFFSLTGVGPRAPNWEPPVDVWETDTTVFVLVALPGVGADKIEMSVVNGELIVTSMRTMPDEMRGAVLHRLEIPFGRFECRVQVPREKYAKIDRELVAGCLLVRLRKPEAVHG